MKRKSSVILGVVCFFVMPNTWACGGFFCALSPIVQSAEQIVFRKEADQITTMVSISYVGDAESFAWVLPVPNTPELSVGSDMLFEDLELATRPQFRLTRGHDECRLRFPPSVPLPTPNPADVGGGGGDVVIEQTLSVGPFDAQIISGTDPGKVAAWLSQNNFNLSDRGSELLQPYIDSGMKFVLLKLQSNRDTGDIQPIILKYTGEKPTIPLRLTAVAAQRNMGLLVWLLSDSRAVPDNFLHVTPNYTRLNWYRGPVDAYVSYQNLVASAVDEAGGQGFATDYAGKFPNLKGELRSSLAVADLMNSLASVSDAEFLSLLWNNTYMTGPVKYK